MSNVYLLMANGLEECEALITVDLLRRADIDITTVSIHEDPEIIGAHEINILADMLIDDVDDSKITMLILPGGMPGTSHLANSSAVDVLINKTIDDGGWLAAICAAPSVFGKKGLLDGHKATAFPNFADQLGEAEYTGTPVEVLPNRIVTGKALGAAIPFSLKLIEVLKDRKTAENIAKTICYEGTF
ncbi:MAG TPA: DJ-1/PfpI family protein [Clostridiaceae bacterium]|nr:DJ-1/PfpI family protein [Clostridiaceae bacterium]